MSFHHFLPERCVFALTQYGLVFPSLISHPLPSAQRQIDNNSASGQPTATDLAACAVAHTDFIGDLDAATLVDNATNSADLAADIWTDAHDDCPVSLALIVAARRLLVEHGYLLLCEREQAEIDALADGVDAGDLELDGTPIPYPTYRGGV